MKDMTDRLPEWLRRELMARYDAMMRDELRGPPVETEVESLARLGYDGSRLRRRYWKKVKEA
jgi:hypothetical protein